MRPLGIEEIQIPPDQPAGLGDGGTGIRSCKSPERKYITQYQGVERPVELSHQGPIRDRLGRGGRGDGLLRYGLTV